MGAWWQVSGARHGKEGGAEARREYRWVEDLQQHEPHPEKNKARGSLRGPMIEIIKVAKP